MNRILLFVILCIFTLQSCTKQETISYQAQFKLDTEAISSFVTSNNPAAKKTPGGIWYSIDDLSNGVYPTLFDTVTILYTVKEIKNGGLNLVGSSASSTIEPLSRAISGLQQGLILFPTASSGRIYIPSGLAFGTSGHYDPATQITINPNANLLYEIKLISVKGTRLTNDIATIDSYLQTNSIKALHDESGIRYTIDAIDSVAINPPKPSVTDSIVVTYKEKILTPYTLVTSVNSTKIALKDQVTAWRIMLPKYVAKGTTITMYVPSGYAYGSFGKKDVASNSNMIYELTLNPQ